MRSAPPAYDRQDQQDVRNTIDRNAADTTKPKDEFYMNDRVDGKIYRVTMESGAFVIAAI